MPVGESFVVTNLFLNLQVLCSVEISVGILPAAMDSLVQDIGDTMAPYIFILCMDIILQQLNPEWGAVIENEFELNEFTGEVEHLHGRRGRRLPRRLTNCQ